MGGTLSSGGKIVATLVSLVAVLSLVFSISLIVILSQQNFTRKYEGLAYGNYITEFRAMEAYGKPIPLPNIIATLNLYGTPESVCLQMEDLKGKMDGNPYPTAYRDEEKIKELLSVLHKYYSKKVYVYVATPNDQLQICISELPHDKNPDGANQDWEVD